MSSEPEAQALACVDVAYRDDGSALAACVLARAWTDSEPSREVTVEIDGVAPYVPGRFYERELPCVMAALQAVGTPVAVVVIDGYVLLDGEGRPGLGAFVFEALDGEVPVVGVAKNPFAGSAHASQVLRGSSTRPLFVTALGIEQADAALHVRTMHGPHRLPTLIGRADQLCRGR